MGEPAHRLLDLAKARQWAEVHELLRGDAALLNRQPCGRYSAPRRPFILFVMNRN